MRTSNLLGVVKAGTPNAIEHTGEDAVRCTNVKGSALSSKVRLQTKQ